MIIIFLTIIISLLAAKSIIKPILFLKKQADAISENQFDAVLSLDINQLPHDEIGALGLALQVRFSLRVQQL